MERERIDGMTYAEFSERFSVGEPQGNRDNYLSSNETKFSCVIDSIREENKGAPLHYMGVIGGFDMASTYISTLNPDFSFHFDIAKRPVHHLGLRMCAFQDAGDVGEYVMNLAAVADSDRKMFTEAGSMEEFLHMINHYEPKPGTITAQGADFMKRLGYKRIDPEIAEVLFDVRYRNKAVRDCVNYFGRLQSAAKKGHSQLRYSWHSPANFGNVRAAALEGRIRAFNADFFHGFSDTAGDLIDAYGIKNLVLYLSNIPDGVWIDVAENIRSKEFGVGDVKFNEMANESVNDRLDAVLVPLAKKVDNLWVVASHHDKNKIIGRAKNTTRKA